jgi:hypothetical protein
MRALAVAMVLLLLDAAQAAEPSPQPTRGAASPPRPVSLSHKYQVGLALRSGSGYRVIAPYHEEFCGEKTSTGANKSVCGGRLRTWLEISPSFGVTAGLELLVDLRFYLESDLADTRGLFVAPGIKYYTDAESWFKFFATGQLVLEHQDLSSASVSNFDVGLRSALGLHFDVLRYLGFFVQGGVNLAFKRWLTFVVDFGAGIQGRY